jgi:cyclopropane fatty-acyl-phospholipid synthase-like methyltransferase
MLVERTVPGLHAHLAAVLDKEPRSTAILDVGCGTGAWLNRLAGKGFTTLCGIDKETAPLDGCDIAMVSEDIVHGARALGERTFDVITAIEVIEHLGNVDSLFQLAHAVLRPGGNMLITTPNIQSVAARSRFLATGRMRHFDRHGDPTHVFPILLPCMHRMAERHGFEVEMVWTYPEDRTSYGIGTSARIVAWLLKWICPDDLPGDVLCLVLKRRPAHV